MRKIFCLLIILFSISVKAWAAYPTYTVCASSCDFTTLQGAVNDLNTNHNPYASNVTITISSSGIDTTAVNITAAPSTTQTLTITTTGAARHNGKTGTGYIMNQSASSCILMNASGNYHISGISFELSASTYGQIALGINFNTYDTGTSYISDCIFWSGATMAYYASQLGINNNARMQGTYYVWNNIFTGLGTNGNSNKGSLWGGSGLANSGTWYIYNNTIQGMPNSGAYGIYFGSTSAQTIYLKNNSVTNVASNTCYSITGSSTASGNNNLSSDTTAPGTSAYKNATVTFVNAPSNLNLSASDTGATGHGANLSADSGYAFSDDIIGTTRTVPWDIGAFKAPATTTPGAIINNATINNAIIK